MFVVPSPTRDLTNSRNESIPPSTIRINGHTLSGEAALPLGLGGGGGGGLGLVFELVDDEWVLVCVEEGESNDRHVVEKVATLI